METVSSNWTSERCRTQMGGFIPQRTIAGPFRQRCNPVITYNSLLTLVLNKHTLQISQQIESPIPETSIKTLNSTISTRWCMTHNSPKCSHLPQPSVKSWFAYDLAVLYRTWSCWYVCIYVWLGGCENHPQIGKWNKWPSHLAICMAICTTTSDWTSTAETCLTGFTTPLLNNYIWTYSEAQNLQENTHQHGSSVNYDSNMFSLPPLKEKWPTQEETRGQKELSVGRREAGEQL